MMVMMMMMIVRVRPVHVIEV